MTIKELRISTGMTQTEFGNYLNIPMRTIQNWEGGQRNCPEYVTELMAYKINKEELNIMDKNFEGMQWGELSKNEQEYLLDSARAWGNPKESTECIIDFVDTRYSIAGYYKVGEFDETFIEDNAVIYISDK